MREREAPAAKETPLPAETQSCPGSLRTFGWLDLFSAPTGPATLRDVIVWWEARRGLYNGIVFGAGVSSFCLYLLFALTSGLLEPGEDAVEPLALAAALIIAPLAVNLCYCLGSLAELLLRAVSRDRTRRAGPPLLKVGLAFSLALVSAPTLVWGALWFRHIVLKG